MQIPTTELLWEELFVLKKYYAHLFFEFLYKVVTKLCAIELSIEATFVKRHDIVLSISFLVVFARLSIKDADIGKCDVLSQLHEARPPTNVRHKFSAKIVTKNVEESFHYYFVKNKQLLILV